MMDGRQTKHASLASSCFEHAHLNGDRPDLDHVEAAQQRQQELGVRRQRQQCKRGANGQRTHVAHEDSRWGRIPPKKAGAGPGEGRSKDGEVVWVDERRIQIVIPETNERDNGKGGKGEHRRAAGETIETVGDVDGIGGAEDDRPRPDHPQRRTELPTRKAGSRNRQMRVDVGARHQRCCDTEGHEQRDVSLELPQHAAVALQANLDVVIHETNECHRQHTREHHEGLIRKHHTFANVAE